MHIDLLIKNGQVITAAQAEYPVRGKKMQDLEVIEQGWVACAASRLWGRGRRSAASRLEITESTVIDAAGRL